MSKFQQDIIKFNGMYKLPVATEPSLDQLGVAPIARLKAFKSILTEELNEIDEIVEVLENFDKARLPVTDVLTLFADLLGDIQVYCASEMVKFGLPLDEVLAIIMQSNFSKLGEDGKPIYDERGKVQKGPGYWKPEPAIKKLLTTMLAGPGHLEARALLDGHNAKISAGKNYGAFDPLPINPE